MDANTLSQEVTALHAEICGALADPRRILMLYALSGQSCKVGDLAQQLGISQPSTSRHLKILRERGLVLAARDGMNVEYRLADPRLIEALDLLRGVLRDHLAYHASLVE
jgi:ArsR family transcriptional regulator